MKNNLNQKVVGYEVVEDTLIKRCGCDENGVKMFLREFFCAISNGEEVHIRGFGRFYLDIVQKKVIFVSDESSCIIKMGIKWILSEEGKD